MNGRSTKMSESNRHGRQPKKLVNEETRGGAEGTRTPDFLRAKEALSQLSYSPAKSARIIA